MDLKIKIGLIWRIVIAIALAISLGLLTPMIGEGFAKGFVSLFATFNMIFGGFLNFVVPLIIIAFIAPGIAKLGKGSGKLLGLAAFVAYLSTIAAGILAFFSATTLLPNFIGNFANATVKEGTRV
ncbi:cation:dicarboxylase symporter family transporter, partial [Microvirga sp. 3-52]|nr:cation:dicarboxylase symporter family transporter [Microvirga sp. 3-52]